MTDKVLRLLSQDARLSADTIAHMIGSTEAAVTACIAELERSKTVIGYQALIDWDKTDREFVTALIEVKITPQKGMGYDDIARRIYSHPQVQSVYLMSGGFDLTVIIAGRTLRDVARFVAEQLAPTESVLSTATHFILKKYKEQGVEFDPSSSDLREDIRGW